jgi:hypothetical protein
MNYNSFFFSGGIGSQCLFATVGNSFRIIDGINLMIPICDTPCWFIVRDIDQSDSQIMKVNLNKVSLVLVFVSWLTSAFTDPELFLVIQLHATLLFTQYKRDRDRKSLGSDVRDYNFSEAQILEDYYIWVAVRRWYGL